MGVQKLLLPIGDRAMIARVADAVLAAPVERVFVVTAHSGSGVAEALAGRSIHLVPNADPNGDMLSSVRHGLRALPHDCAAAVVVLGDQPEVSAEMLTLLVRTFRATGAGIVVPVYQCKRGHPLLVAARYHAEILERYDGIGLRGLLNAHPADVMEVEVDTPSILEDVDVPEDYRRAVTRLKTGQRS